MKVSIGLTIVFTRIANKSGKQKRRRIVHKVRVGGFNGCRRLFQNRLRAFNILVCADGVYFVRNGNAPRRADEYDAVSHDGACALPK